MSNSADQVRWADTVPDGQVLVGFVKWDGDEFHDFRYARAEDRRSVVTFDGWMPVFAWEPEGGTDGQSG